MSDDPVGVLLCAEADRLSLGVTPPPLDLLTARHRRPLMPVAAAAAVVLVAGVAFAAVRSAQEDRGPVPITNIGAVVPFDKDASSSTFGDVPAPGRDRRSINGMPFEDKPVPYANDGNPLCLARDVEASLELAPGDDAGRLKLRWTGAKVASCRLHDDVPSVVLYDADGNQVAESTYTEQPPVVNPPAITARYLYGDARITGFTWRSNCGAPAVRAEVIGLTTEPFPAALTGTQPSCDGRSATPRLGLFGGAGVAPADRDGLRVRLLPVTGTPAAGSVVTLVAELANPTRSAISLSPCPTWLFESREVVGQGRDARGYSSGQSIRVPCDRLPGAVASAAAVRFEIQDRLGTAIPDIRGIQSVDLRFGIAGAVAWAGSVSVDHGTPVQPVATVPWKDTPAPPGVAQTGASAIGTKAPLASLHPSIEGLPASVHPGDLLRYKVRVTNMATGGDPVSFDPCPGFVQSLSLNGKDQLADEHYVNCGAAPAAIAPGTAIWLEMELQIPADAPRGNAGLAWKLGKLDFTGSESAMATVVIT